MNSARGFSINELLVVIVVIGLLAALGTFAYINIQKNARDSQRLTNAETATLAIQSYIRDNDAVPPSHPTSGEWEQSAVRGEDFLQVLQQASYLRSGTTLDPVNNQTYQFYYARYDPSIASQRHHCATDRGPYFVFGVRQLEALGESGGQPVADAESPGWRCESGTGSRDWQSEFAWVTGGYLADFGTTGP